MTQSFVDELERRILPQLELVAAQLRREFPQVRISTWSSFTGTAVTDNPAYDLGIDCVFLGAPTDTVALFIGVVQVNSEPHLSDLAVCWGADTRADYPTFDLLGTPVPCTQDSINQIEDALPKLCEALRTALQNHQTDER